MQSTQIQLTQLNGGWEIAQSVKPPALRTNAPWRSRVRVSGPPFLECKCVLLSYPRSAAQMHNKAERCVLLSMVACRIKIPWDCFVKSRGQPRSRASVLATMITHLVLV